MWSDGERGRQGAAAWPAPPEGTFFLDILTQLGEAYALGDLETERVDFDGIEVTIVTPGMLDRMKRSPVRPQNRADAYRLTERFGIEGGL